MRIGIFGTGSTAQEALNQLSDKVAISFIVDNDKEKHGEFWNNYKIISTLDIYKYNYDYILICSMYTTEIIESLLKNGIDREKIIPYFDHWDPCAIEQTRKEKEIKNYLFYQDNKRKIALVSTMNSGCNCYALYKNMPTFIKEHFNVSLINLDEYRRNWRKYEVVFTTHMEWDGRKNKINIETWHGFPLKAMGKLRKNIVDIKNANNFVNYFLSYSNMYSYIMSSICGIDIDKFVSTGMPRNDFLANEDSRNLISKLIGKKLFNKKIIYYIPTFKSRKNTNISEGIDLFIKRTNLELINKYMEELNCYFIVKKHPFEGIIYEDKVYENIFFLDDKNFNNLGIDLYETLGGSDILVTDYSSVYFDYLLLNKPIIFNIYDKEIYEKDRGFLFKNIKNLMPGPHVKTVHELINAIREFIKNSNLYRYERENLKNIVHDYEDYESSRRVWETFYNYYNIKN